MLPSSIRPTVSETTITKVTRLFNGTLTDILNELLQNARRAGAEQIRIDTEQDAGGSFHLTIQDDGSGIEDPTKLLTLGSSGWDSEIQGREDPAGMGVFSLAGRAVTITSRHASHDHGWKVAIPADAWTGEADLALVEADHSIGTTIAFSVTDAKEHHLTTAVKAAAKYHPQQVLMNGVPCAQEAFLAEALHIVEWRGSRIGVFAGSNPHGSPTANFHGLTITGSLGRLSESLNGRSFHARIDIGDTPDLQLVLPARKEFVVNACHAELKLACERAIFEAIAQRPSHRLAFDQWQRAAELGISLPEAEQVLIHWQPGEQDYRNSGSDYNVTAVTDRSILVEEDEIFIEQPMDRALTGHALRPHLLEPHQGYGGYSWYDALPKLHDIAFVVATDEGDIRIATGDENRQVLTSDIKTRSITCHWAITLPDGTTDRHWIATDVAFSMDEHVWSTELDDMAIAWTAQRDLDPGQLVGLLQAVCFSPSDDCGADSWDTQQERFLSDARSRARTILLSADEAIIDDIRELIASNRWRLPQGRAVAIAIDRDTINVALGDLPEAA